MKKFIFRNPFAKKLDKVVGKILLETAQKRISIANEKCKNYDDTYTDEGVAMILEAAELIDSASRRLGFRSVADMYEYVKSNGKL